MKYYCRMANFLIFDNYTMLIKRERLSKHRLNYLEAEVSKSTLRCFRKVIYVHIHM